MRAVCVTVIAWAIVMLHAATTRANEPPTASNGRVVANRTATPTVDPKELWQPSEQQPLARRTTTPRTAGADTTDRSIRNETDTHSMMRLGWSGWFGSLLPLLVVLAVIGVLVLLVRRYLPQRWRVTLTGAGALEVVARHAISSKQSLALVRVGRRMVLVGLTPERLTRLETITDPDEIAELTGRISSTRPDSLTSTFQREVVHEMGAYDPARDGGLHEMAGLSQQDEMYRGARAQVRGVLERVRRLTGAV